MDTKYFIDSDSNIYAVLDGQEHIIQGDWVELSDEELAERLKPTPEQIAESESAKAKAERATAMLSGGSYTIGGTDYQISFTADDGNGMMQVRTAFDLGVEATTIHFENGTKMPITSAEFSAFAAWFVQKRNEFFV